MDSTKPLRSALKTSEYSPAFTRIPLPPSPSLPQSSLPPTPTPPDDPLPSFRPIFVRTASSPPPSADNPLPSSTARHIATPHPTPIVPVGTHRPVAGRGPSPLPSALHTSPSPHPHHSLSPSLAETPTTATTITANSAAAVPKTPYTPKVSFDTFENPLASMFSFTLQVKTAGYKRTHHTRVYLCAASPDESGQEALDWCLESLAQDGDEVIVFRGLDEEVLEKDHDILRDNARGLMRSIQSKVAAVDGKRKLSLILEYVPGKVTDTIDRLIALYRPDSLVVGTRGKRGIMGMGMVGIGLGGIGSVSKYCLSHSPVPVVVVRPERQLKKAVEKRKADPKRGTHFDSL